MKNMKYLFTLLLFYLCLPSTICAADIGFPFEGGMTSDSIIISNVKLENFTKVEENRIQYVESSKKSTMSFFATVPEGKTAQFSFSLLLHVDVDDDEIDLSSIIFKARVDGMLVKICQDKEKIERKSVTITIPAGNHNVTLEATYEVPKGCAATGSLNGLSIHVHKYGNVQLMIEPICGVNGELKDSCLICKRDTFFKLSPKYSEHKLIMIPAKKGSCLDNLGDVKKCEQCPYTEITRVQQVKDHEFDTNGTCKVCGLHMPKSNADGSVYEINDAGEMRILSEMVSIGKIPGNIGINIKADLVFDKVPMLPLGTFSNPFQGVLNGNGHRISGVTNGFQGFDGMGFVGVAKGTITAHAVIANLIFDGGNTIRGAALIGGIVGYASFCDIYNCASFGTLDGTDYVGGIVGFADQQVGIVNCGAATNIKTAGKWNPIVCNMTDGHIQNSYGVSTISDDGTLDEVSTPYVRHCFSSHGSGQGITRITQDMLSSYDMRQWLSEQSESVCFTTSKKEIYPVPVVNTTIVTKSNGPVNITDNMVVRRAPSALEEDWDSEKGDEIEVLRGYVNDNSSIQSGQTVEEVMRADSTDYPDHEHLYVISRSVPKGFGLYDKISGGDLLDFESYRFPADSSYIRNRIYDIVAPGQMKAVTETVGYLAGGTEQLDEYSIEDGDYTLKSRIIFEYKYNIIYQENIDGRLRTVWTNETMYDDLDRPMVTNIFSHNYITGEKHLDFSYTYNDDVDDREDGSYEEYLDTETNTIHVIYNYLDSITGQVTIRDHYIVRASDEYLLEIRTEKMTDGQPSLIDGIYFLYDDKDYLEQIVAFGPVDANHPEGDVRPYLYEEYIGYEKGHKFPAAIQVPEVKQPSLQKRMDYNIYNARGHVVRKVTDVNDPFNGLPRGLYIYQGSKYLVREK